MTRRGDLKRLRELEILQRVERDVAALDVAEAQAREIEAMSAAERAAERAGSLAIDWDTAMGAARFVPEMTAAIGAALLQADDTAAAAARRAGDMSTLREARTDHWRRVDATVRAAGAVVRDHARDVARHEEEASLAAVTERVTFGWSRR